MARIMVGIPAYQTMPPETEEDYMRFMYYLGRRYQEHEFFLGIKRKSEQFRARNAIVMAAYQCNAQYLLMLDDDHVIDLEGTSAPSTRYEFLRRLLSHMESIPNAGIVGALYYHRGGECRPVLMEEKDGQYFYLRDDQIKHELQEVSVQGGGCMLISMKVFDKIGAEPFEPEFEYGTDFQICLKAKKAGFGVYCDTAIEIGHVKSERSVVTKNNRHLHYAATADQSDKIRENAIIGRIMREFRADVKEYLKVESDSALLELANQYKIHNDSFNSYRENKKLKQYYVDSGPSYLARACFIRNEYEPKQFDSFVLQTVKADKPGVGMDYGCGSAPITFELCRKGQMIYFYDVPGSVPFEFLKWRANKYSLYGTKALFSDSFPDHSTLDYAMFLDSIEHIEDWREVLSQAAVALKHGGCLITNFMLLGDTTNKEHIFMDHAAFMGYVTRLKLWPINSAIFQKREDFKSADDHNKNDILRN